jgi:glycine cleavage system aminomethyltransferase T
VDQPIAMAYLPLDHAAAQHEVFAEVRGKRLPMRVWRRCPSHPTATTAADRACVDRHLPSLSFT